MAGTLTISTLSDGTNSTSSTNCIKGSAKAWVRWNGNAGAVITDSYNVSSVTRAASSQYTISYTNALANANYCAVGMGDNTNNSQGTMLIVDDAKGSPTTSLIYIMSRVPAVGVAADTTMGNVVIFGS